jgi:hypothetical protein
MMADCETWAVVTLHFVIVNVRNFAFDSLEEWIATMEAFSPSSILRINARK